MVVFFSSIAVEPKYWICGELNEREERSGEVHLCPWRRIKARDQESPDGIFLSVTGPIMPWRGSALRDSGTHGPHERRYR